MEKEHVYKKVKEALISSCRINESEISPDKTLVEDLCIDSIDLIDLLYALENEFNVSIKISEFENFAKNEMAGVPFSINNVITEEGLKALRLAMPEVPEHKIQAGLTVSKIPYLLTVQTLTNIVIKKTRL